MAKLDLTKKHKEYYSSKKEPTFIELSPANFLMISGRGAPGSQVYTDKVGALYNVAYGIKGLAKQMEQDFTVCKLEGLWWFDQQFEDLRQPPREQWNWTMMIRQPDFITEAMYQQAQATAFEKKGLADIQQVEFVNFEEGLSAQVMHIGPYANEESTVAKLHTFVRDNGYQLRGKHHEIYLSDPNRSAPENMKTIIRQPVKKA